MWLVNLLQVIGTLIDCGNCSFGGGNLIEIIIEGETFVRVTKVSL